MEAALTLSCDVGIKPACVALDIPRSGFYRREARKNALPAEPKKRPIPPRALSSDERQGVLDLLHSDRFADQAPHQVYAILLDEGEYRCSIRTMYRILDAHTEVKERRNQLSHPVYQKPELLATAPNQVWSWDITKLLGPVKWSYFYLYVILDIFSRYVVGWMIAPAESAALAEKLIREACEKQHIESGRLTIHADRGSSMRSKPVAFLLADLGVTRTHSRPHTSDDNPYSEAQFKTLKYRPDFPGSGPSTVQLPPCKPAARVSPTPPTTETSIPNLFPSPEEESTTFQQKSTEVDTTPDNLTSCRRHARRNRGPGGIFFGRNGRWPPKHHPVSNRLVFSFKTLCCQTQPADSKKETRHPAPRWRVCIPSALRLKDQYPQARQLALLDCNSSVCLRSCRINQLFKTRILTKVLEL